MKAPHPAALPIDVLMRDVEFRTTRGPGPGGQHRNKSDTMVRLTHRPTGVQAQGGERRSQDLNRVEAIQRLRVQLALRHREPVPLPALPSALWHSRLRGSKFAVSADHDDFPALLAEALDLLAALDDDVPATARTLALTTSQFVKFLAREPAALAELNGRRTARGKPPLR